MRAAELVSWRDKELATGAELFLWNEGGLRRLFPLLSTTLASSSGLAATPRKVSKYFFFHASLLLWQATFGHAYPRLEYYWRMEPDVAFAGPLATMLELARPVRADVLLPHIESERQNPTWPHWKRNAPLLVGVPAEKRLMSLVPVGRYSWRFLNGTMAARWSEGYFGYEEITLPTACATSHATPCALESLHANAKIRSAKRVVFRPVWDCSDFLAARQRQTYELWHPVKNRSCFVAWLDGQAAAAHAGR